MLRDIRRKISRSRGAPRSPHYQFATGVVNQVCPQIQDALSSGILYCDRCLIREELS
jgi:hypothetical protein